MILYAKSIDFLLHVNRDSKSQITGKLPIGIILAVKKANRSPWNFIDVAKIISTSRSVASFAVSDNAHKLYLVNVVASRHAVDDDDDDDYIGRYWHFPMSSSTVDDSRQETSNPWGESLVLSLWGSRCYYLLT